MPNPQPDQVFAGRYRVQRKLAAGGMGTVFAAEKLESGEQVALKILHPELSDDPEMHRRFRREASILKALRHPGVVRILELGQTDEGTSYHAMELLTGETLRERMRRGPVPLAEALPIAKAVFAALGAAHDHGVLHGDIKPENIFLTEDPDRLAVMVDFGTSKVLGLERLTRTGEITGTPKYMAPELLTGKGTIDERIDIYALGILLYEMLSGETPFRERQPAKLLFQIVSGGSVPLIEVAPEVPEAVVQVVEMAMAPEREQRFAEVGALSAALSHAAAS